MLEKSLWNGKSPYSEWANELRELVPVEGEVEHHQYRNRALEKFRKATNCYYDLYNNGLCNRGRAFSKVFGITLDQYCHKRGMYHKPHKHLEDKFYGLVESKFNKIIIAAVVEQFPDKIEQVITATLSDQS